MKVEVSKYIVIDTEICHGKPTFKGTRIMVSDILELIAAGEPVENILRSYPSITTEMINEALRYAAKLARGERYIEFKFLLDENIPMEVREFFQKDFRQNTFRKE